MPSTPLSYKKIDFPEIKPLEKCDEAAVLDSCTLGLEDFLVRRQEVRAPIRDPDLKIRIAEVTLLVLQKHTWLWKKEEGRRKKRTSARQWAEVDHKVYLRTGHFVQPGGSHKIYRKAMHATRNMWILSIRNKKTIAEIHADAHRRAQQTREGAVGYEYWAFLQPTVSLYVRRKIAEQLAGRRRGRPRRGRRANEDIDDEVEEEKMEEEPRNVAVRQQSPRRRGLFDDDSDSDLEFH